MVCILVCSWDPGSRGCKEYQIWFTIIVLTYPVNRPAHPRYLLFRFSVGTWRRAYRISNSRIHPCWTSLTLPKAQNMCIPSLRLNVPADWRLERPVRACLVATVCSARLSWYSEKGFQCPSNSPSLFCICAPPHTTDFEGLDLPSPQSVISCLSFPHPLSPVVKSGSSGVYEFYA